MVDPRAFLLPLPSYLIHSRIAGTQLTQTWTPLLCVIRFPIYAEPWTRTIFWKLYDPPKTGISRYVAEKPKSVPTMAQISARADHFPIGKYSTYMLVRTIRVVRKEELPIGSRTWSRRYTLSQSSVFKCNTSDVLFYERNGLQGWVRRRCWSVVMSWGSCLVETHSRDLCCISVASIGPRRA